MLKKQETLSIFLDNVFLLKRLYIKKLNLNVIMRTKNNYRCDYIKASRKGSRDAYLDNKTGFVSIHKIHKSKKSYSRKIKHKNYDRI